MVQRCGRMQSANLTLKQCQVMQLAVDRLRFVVAALLLGNDVQLVVLSTAWVVGIVRPNAAGIRAAKMKLHTAVTNAGPNCGFPWTSDDENT